MKKVKKNTKNKTNNLHAKTAAVLLILFSLLILSLFFLNKTFNTNSKAYNQSCAKELSDLQSAQGQLDKLNSRDPAYKRAQDNFNNRTKLLLQCQQNQSTNQSNNATNATTPTTVLSNNLSDAIDILFSNETGKQVKLTRFAVFKGFHQINIDDFFGQAVVEDNGTFPLTHKICNEILDTYPGDKNPTRENRKYTIQADYSILNTDNTYSKPITIEDSFSVVQVGSVFYCDKPNLTLHALRDSIDHGSITLTNHTSPPKAIQVSSLLAESSPFLFVNTKTELLTDLGTIRIEPYQSKNIPINNCQDHASTIAVTLKYSAIFSSDDIRDEAPIKASFDCKGQNTITITHSDKKGALEQTVKSCEDGKTTSVEGCGPDGSGIQICTQRLTREIPHRCVNVNCGRCML